MSVHVMGQYMYLEQRDRARLEFARNMGLQKDAGFASRCTECGKCEMHCPQHIPIREKLKEADRALRPLPYRIGLDIARIVMKRNRM